MSDQKTLRCAFDDRGGRAEITALDSPELYEFREVASRLIQGAADAAWRFRSIRPCISLDFYCVDELSAASRKIGDHFFIGLSRGLWRSLWNLYLPLVRTGGLLEFLLNRQGQVNPRSMSNVEVETMQLEESLLRMLCDEALRFMFHHELAHIMNGHLGYIEKLAGNPNGLARVTRQALEMDADSAAVSQGLSRIVARIESGWRFRPEFSTPVDLLFIWRAATYTLFRHLAFKGPVLERLDEFTHTPPQLRAFQAQGILVSCLLGRKDGTSAVNSSPAIDELVAALRCTADAIAIVELGLADVQGEAPDMVPIQQALSDDAKRLMMHDHRTAWAAVCPELEPHAFVGLAPPMV